MKNDAEIYNQTKAQVFSIYNKDTMSKVLNFLASQKKELNDIHTMIGDIAEAYEYDENFDIYGELTKELANTAKFLRKVTGRYIVACGQRKYKITDPRDGDGEFITQLYWKHPIIANMIPDEIDTDISLEL